MHWSFRRKKFQRINKTINKSANNYVLMNLFEQRHKKIDQNNVWKKIYFYCIIYET